MISRSDFISNSRKWRFLGICKSWNLFFISFNRRVFSRRKSWYFPTLHNLEAIPLRVRALICKASPQTTILGRSRKKTWKSIYFISLEKKHGNNKFLVLLERITTTRAKNVWLRILIFVPVAHKKYRKMKKASEVYLKWLLKDATRWS